MVYNPPAAFHLLPAWDFWGNFNDLGFIAPLSDGISVCLDGYRDIRQHSPGNFRRQPLL